MNATIPETLHWRAVADELPDDDTYMMVYAPGANEPVWLGFYDGEDWISVDMSLYGKEDEIAAKVTHWAEMPHAPKP